MRSCERGARAPPVRGTTEADQGATRPSQGLRSHGAKPRRGARASRSAWLPRATLRAKSEKNDPRVDSGNFQRFEVVETICDLEPLEVPTIYPISKTRLRAVGALVPEDVRAFATDEMRRTKILRAPGTSKRRTLNMNSARGTLCGEKIETLDFVAKAAAFDNASPLFPRIFRSAWTRYDTRHCSCPKDACLAALRARRGSNALKLFNALKVSKVPQIRG